MMITRFSQCFSLKIFLIVCTWINCSAFLKKKSLIGKNGNVWIWNRSKDMFYDPNGRILETACPEYSQEFFYRAIRGSVIQVIAQNMEPYIISNKHSNNISGYLGDMWNILQTSLQFKSNVTEMKDFQEGREMIKRNEADVYLAAMVYTSKTTNMYFSQPYFNIWYHLYFKLPEGKPANYLHFKAFSIELWMLILLLLLFLTIILWMTCIVLRRTFPKSETLLSIPTYFLGIISAFFNTGYNLQLRSCSARLQIFVALFFGVLCYYALSASLVASLATLDRPKPFTSLQKISAIKKYSLCMRNITYVYDNFTDQNGTILPQWQGIVNNERCPDMLKYTSIPGSICQEDIGFLENNIIMALALQRMECRVSLLPQRYFVTGNYIAISKKFKQRKAISIMMTRIKSTGVARKLESKWVKHIPIFLSSQEANQINFSHVKGLILIYAALIMVSLAILVMEICWEKIRYNMEEKKYNILKIGYYE